MIRRTLKMRGGHYWTLCLFESYKALRAFARKHGTGDHAATVACVLPQRVEYYGPKQKNGISGALGFICLPLPLTTGILAHEATHAALETWRMLYRRDARFGSECGKAEEDLAWLVGDIARQIALADVKRLTAERKA